LAPLVFLRPGELRQAEWMEIDFAKKEWRIGPHKMKMRAVHIVPLSEQALKILQEVKANARNSNYVFPSVTSNKRPMSDNTLNMALRRMGFDKSQMTAHGFRSIASTLLHEQGWLHDAIERQLAHGKRDKVSGAYDYSQYLPTRKKMMQHWADYLDALRVGSNVVEIKGKVA
jgi:integrase